MKVIEIHVAKGKGVIVLAKEIEESEFTDEIIEEDSENLKKLCMKNLPNATFLRTSEKLSQEPKSKKIQETIE